MAAPDSLVNSDSQALDTLYGEDGDGRLKLAVGALTGAGLDPEVSWAGVATHTDGDTFDTSDGVLVPGLIDPFDNSIHAAIGDADGRQEIVTHPIADEIGADVASTTITSGGTEQTALAANADRVWLFIQNLHASEDLWFNFTDDAAITTAGSIRLAPWEKYEMSGNFVATDLISVIATTTGHKFTAKEA